MENLTFTDEYGIEYEIILKRRTGHWVMIQIGKSQCPWVLRCPDGSMKRFRTEYDLWKYALIDNKLF